MGRVHQGGKRVKAKVWCISKGYNDYNKVTDDCK